MIGTPQELVERHCPERCVVFSSAETDVAARLAGAPAILSMSSEGSTHTLRGQSEDFVTEVINIIARAGIRITGFRTEVPNLEDVFLKLTGHGIRD